MTEALYETLQATGLSLVGVTQAKPDSAAERRYREWLRHAYQGSMRYLQAQADRKFCPERLLPGCRSIICVAASYYQAVSWPAATAEGRVARYAWGRDYHRVLGDRLRKATQQLSLRFPDHRFRACVDATALAEKHYAAAAGLGSIAKNTLLVTARHGSWIVLGEILSTREFTLTAPSGPSACPEDCCACLIACPTGALHRPYVLEARRCISYLTVEHKGTIPPKLRPAVGAWLFGCDRCQEVCPRNADVEPASDARLTDLIAGPALDLAMLLGGLDEEEFDARLTGSPLVRIGRLGLTRNACIVAANLRATDLLPQLLKLAEHADAILSEHARWAVAALRSEQAPDVRSPDLRGQRGLPPD